MGLEEYRSKRDFRVSPEPRGGTGREATPALAFVVQKHQARRLHYDFRLELDGVLKSWAVPQGPSTDPGDRRLAVQVEDHPLEYGDFEGAIPKGQYGGGTVMLWDRGLWRPVGDPAESHARGKLKFQLEGEKLKGGYTLVRMRGQGGRNWLLIKERDAHASDDLPDDVSVASNRSMAEIAADPGRVWQSVKAPDPGLDPASVPGARPADLPARVSPMLASLTEAAPEGDKWLHEIKFDGYRLLVRVEGGQARLFTRNGHDWTGKFPAMAAACAGLPCRSAWLDGELVALDRHGVSRFGLLQDILSRGGDAGLVLHLFDLMHLDGFDLAPAPLEARKDRLKRLLAGAPDLLRYTDHLDGQGAAFHRQACAFALEGVVSKRRDRPYRGGRGKDWVKVKCTRRQEFVVIGWTPPQGRRSGLGALLLAVHEGAALVPAGRVGTGFGEREAAMLEGRLVALERDSPPVPLKAKGVRWAEPRLVVEVEFTEWSRDGQLRHPSYQGLRPDKAPAEVVRESQGVEGDRDDRLAQVELTHPDKVLYPGLGLTKQGLAAYYLDVAAWMLPRVAGRPLTLLRCPDGAEAKCFHQRHPRPGMSQTVRRLPAGDETLIYVEDEEGLLALVQMGALEIHTWGARVPMIERPDLLVFDLDPDEGLDWQRVADGARQVRDRLAGLGLVPFVKTTGGKGLHVVVPLVPGAGWDEVKAFCKGVAQAVAADSPGAFTANMAKARRKGRIFLDYLRNQRSATFVAPFSTRARPGAPVAVPITWAELEGGIRSDHFTVETLHRRLSALARDPWAGMEEAAAPLPRRPA